MWEKEDADDVPDWCIYCMLPVEQCDCGLDPDLASMQGEETHDEIDKAPYED